MSNTKELLKEMGKKFGKGVVQEGAEFAEAARLPTGIFAFDLATAGGIPLGRTTVLFGPESSMKTTVALKALANAQKLFPDKKTVFVDAEGHFESAWAKTLGVETEALIYVLPESAEQLVDIVEAFLHAEDVSMVVVDSLAAMVTQREQDNSAEVAVVGGSALAIGKLYRKSTIALNKARREGRNPAFICINQIRFKIGVMHGDPETMPGGTMFKFASQLTVRLYGKDVMENKINKSKPSFKHCSGIIKKHKVPVFARAFEFDVAAIDSPEHGLEVGKSNDWPTISHYAKSLNLLKKEDKGGWEFFGVHHNTLEEIKETLRADEMYALEIKKKLIEAVKDANLGEEGEGGPIVG